MVPHTHSFARFSRRKAWEPGNAESLQEEDLLSGTFYAASPEAVQALVEAAYARLTMSLLGEDADITSTEELASTVDVYDVLVRLHRELTVDPGTVLASGRGGLIVSADQFALQLAEANRKLDEEDRFDPDAGPQVTPAAADDRPGDIDF
jgi:hypothetical protein